MAKLYFRYGAVGSAKTLNLLAVAHNYERRGRRVIVMKPRVDDRDGTWAVASQAGLGRDAHVLIDDDTVFEASEFEEVACVLVDEAQFLSAPVVEQLRDLTCDPGVPVIAFGLRTDFRTQLFEGSRRLLELADSIEEVKTACAHCNRKAILNLRLVDGVPTRDGPRVALGHDDLHQGVCYAHYRESLP